MTDLEDDGVCGDGGIDAVLSQFEQWALLDVRRTLASPRPVDYFVDQVRGRMPVFWNLGGREWELACENYLLDSYRWYRRNFEQVHPDDAPLSRERCLELAYRDSYEWVYCQVNDTRWRPRVFMDRGW